MRRSVCPSICVPVAVFCVQCVVWRVHMQQPEADRQTHSPRRPLRRPDLIPEMHLSVCPPLQQARRLVYYDRRCPEHQLILAHLVPELREFEIHPCEDNVQLLVILRLILVAIRDTVLARLLGGGTMETLW